MTHEAVRLITASARPVPPHTARFVSQAAALCQSTGARLTPIRRRVLEVLHAAAKPLGAYDLASALAIPGRRMAPITVYRALEFLIEQGLAYRLASQNAYLAASASPGCGKTKAFFICEACGGVDEASSPHLGESLGALLKKRRFSPSARFVEVTGRCAQCQGIH